MTTNPQPISSGETGGNGKTDVRNLRRRFLDAAFNGSEELSEHPITKELLQYDRDWVLWAAATFFDAEGRQVDPHPSQATLRTAVNRPSGGTIPSAVPVAPASASSNRREREGPVSVLMATATEISAAGFLPMPRLLFEGAILGLMEHSLPGLWGTFCVLVFFAEKRDGHVWASKTTLMKLMGISKPETLERRLTKLRYGDKTTGLPALLRRGAKIEFRADGLRRLIQLAMTAIQDEKARQAAIKTARARAGRIGMQRRWARGDNKHATRGH